MWQYQNICYPQDELYHYGIPGMKWGVRKVRDIKKAYSKHRKKKTLEKEKEIKAKLERVAAKTEYTKKRIQLKEAERFQKQLNNPLSKSAKEYRNDLRQKMSAEQYKKINGTFNKKMPGSDDNKQETKDTRSKIFSGKRFVSKLVYGIEEGVKEGVSRGLNDAVSGLIKGSTDKIAKERLGVSIYPKDKIKIKTKNKN